MFLFYLTLSRKIGKFKSLVDTSNRLAAFRRAYVIPDNARVSFCHEDDVDVRRGIKTIIIP